MRLVSVVRRLFRRGAHDRGDSKRQRSGSLVFTHIHALCDCTSVTATSRQRHLFTLHRRQIQRYAYCLRLVLLFFFRLDPMTQRQEVETRLTALFGDYPGQPVPEKVKPIWILPKQETVSGTGISWAICKSAPRSRQITTTAPHYSVFYRPDALSATQPTASKH